LRDGGPRRARAVHRLGAAAHSRVTFQPLRVASLEKGEIVFPDADALTKALIESRIDVLILDPFVKTHSVSENDNAAIDSVARKFNDIAESADCSIELAHHVRKASNFGRAEVTADGWQSFAAQTSIVPFAAITAGRTRFNPGEIATWRWVAAVIAYALMLGGHSHIIGVSPFPA
jgi:hypothetical protein